MSQVLLTFSGKNGDILWSLPAARALSIAGDTIDFAIMPTYGAVATLIEQQPYIRRVIKLNDWHPVHTDCGAWPRIPPSVPTGYDRVYHLTYESRPVKPLILHALSVVGLPLPDPPLPFLFVKDPAPQNQPVIAYAFNQTAMDPKLKVLNLLQSSFTDCEFVDVSTLFFDVAAQVIKGALFFLGCRSANYVVAHGVNQRILTVEPDGGRREALFSCPYGREVMPEIDHMEEFLSAARHWRATA
jgi:hypothetical protein